jgi:hypothetical protein
MTDGQTYFENDAAVLKNKLDIVIFSDTATKLNKFGR